MIEVDNGPVVLFGIILVAYICPFIYSFVVDNYDKKNPQIRE